MIVSVRFPVEGHIWVRAQTQVLFSSSLQALHYFVTYPSHSMNNPLYLIPMQGTGALEISLVWNLKIVLVLCLVLEGQSNIPYCQFGNAVLMHCQILWYTWKAVWYWISSAFIRSCTVFALVFVMEANVLHNNQRYLMRVAFYSKADKPVALISGLNWNLDCWFLWREENRRTRRKTLRAGTRTNNKLNPHVTPGPGIEPRPQRWEASALTTAPSLLPRLPCSFSNPNRDKAFMSSKWKLWVPACICHWLY